MQLLSLAVLLYSAIYAFNSHVTCFLNGYLSVFSNAVVHASKSFKDTIITTVVNMG